MDRRKKHPGGRGRPSIGAQSDTAAAPERDRQRLIAATIDALAGRGLGALTPEDIARAAGLEREDFYSHFDDVSQAAEEAFEAVLRKFLEALIGACEAQEEWPLKVKVAIGATLDFADAAPAQARLLFGEPGPGDPALSRRVLAAREQLASMLAAGRHQSETGRLLPPLTEQALTAGLAGTISARLAVGEAKGLPQLAPDLVTYALLPYLGRDEAARIATRPRPGLR